MSRYLPRERAAAASASSSAAAAASSSATQPLAARDTFGTAASATMAVPQRRIGAVICSVHARPACDCSSAAAAASQSSAIATPVRPPTVALILSSNSSSLPKRWEVEGSAESARLLVIATHVGNLIRITEIAGGVAASGVEHQRLQEILNSLEDNSDAWPSDSQETLGLGGGIDAAGQMFTSTQGKKTLQDAVDAMHLPGETVHLGIRRSNVHDEMLHIRYQAGLVAVASSQPHCLFCYGTAHSLRLQHGAIRQNTLWPQGWTNHIQRYSLKKTSKLDDGLDFPKIVVTATLPGARPSSAYYYVINLQDDPADEPEDMPADDEPLHEAADEPEDRPADDEPSHEPEDASDSAMRE